ncbi:hypothetical protein BGAL_0208g00090 [Botrytis galanthina]|uniref:Uncharacterized protein n=1 Tax=Botrytis galanthina TaxID=278940 RepID=A0A4S8QV96_9HELO|nr:hypothetical protein BGAL_0208g00090 [Botrytis galanthina]
MADQQENELLPETTDGFKVGEKKTLDEYSKMANASGNVLDLVGVESTPPAVPRSRSGLEITM